MIQKCKITKRETQNGQVICELDAIDAWLKEDNIEEQIVAKDWPMDKFWVAI